MNHRVPFLALALLLAVSPARAQASAPLDDRGRPAPAVTRPPRLVSLMPAITESLFALGYGERLVADSSYCDFPEAARKLPKIGGPFDPNYERLLALAPDRVLVMEIIPAAVLAKLDALKLPVVYLHEPRRLTDIPAFMRKLEAFSRAPREAGRPESPALHEFSSRLRAATFSGTPVASCLLLSPQQPLWTAGRDTFLDDFLRTAGCRNAAATLAGWAAIEPEQVAALQPGLVIFIGRAPPAASPLAALLRKRKLKTLVLDEDSLSRPGPRILVPLHQLEAELGTVPPLPAAAPAPADAP